ncbi:MAG: hypothetical protein QOD39_3986 [Mycobacterium sp.]|jgi:hypothetical protein|nr:hypothetical protein [Mycobacterium sp.]
MWLHISSLRWGGMPPYANLLRSRGFPAGRYDAVALASAAIADSANDSFSPSGDGGSMATVPCLTFAPGVLTTVWTV